jgi:protein-tyrosine-phosphatase
VLFLCTHNAGRSQMALGFFQHLAGERAVAWSGGSEPASTINPAAVEAMRERGIDISAEFPKPWTDEIVRAADVVITMGCGDACPVFPGRRYEEWVLDDPGRHDPRRRPTHPRRRRTPGARAARHARRPGRQLSVHLVIVGGSDAGTSAGLRARHLDPTAEVYHLKARDSSTACAGPSGS